MGSSVKGYTYIVGPCVFSCIRCVYYTRWPVSGKAPATVCRVKPVKIAPYFIRRIRRISVSSKTSEISTSGRGVSRCTPNEKKKNTIIKHDNLSRLGNDDVKKKKKKKSPVQCVIVRFVYPHDSSIVTRGSYDGDDQVRT